ncbi:hypothetical protein ACO0R3_000623 [Hanseniaspora guilliermondii]
MSINIFDDTPQTVFYSDKNVLGESNDDQQNYSANIDTDKYDIHQYINYIRENLLDNLSDADTTSDILFDIKDLQFWESFTDFFSKNIVPTIKHDQETHEQKKDIKTLFYYLEIICRSLYRQLELADVETNEESLQIVDIDLAHLLKILIINIVDYIASQLTDSLLVNNLLYYKNTSFLSKEMSNSGIDKDKITTVTYEDEKNWFKKKVKPHKLLKKDNIIHLNKIDSNLENANYIEKPSLEAQSISPLKIIHVLDTLRYLSFENESNHGFKVPFIVYQQMLKMIFNNLKNKVFNLLIDDDYLKTRNFAIQIKLNIQNLRDWCDLEVHTFMYDLHSAMVNDIDSLLKSNYPFKSEKNYIFKNINKYDEGSAYYYKNSIRQIFDDEFSEIDDMLEFLTILSNFNDKENHLNDFNDFLKNRLSNNLNKDVLYILVKKYRYEEGEKHFKFKKLLITGNNEPEIVKYANSYKNINKICIPFLKELVYDLGDIKRGLGQIHRRQFEMIHEANDSKRIHGINDIDEKLQMPKKAYYNSDDNNNYNELSVQNSLQEEIDNDEPFELGSNEHQESVLEENSEPSSPVGEYYEENPW